MSTTVSAFNEMMNQFLLELIETFPNEKAMKKYHLAFEMAKSTNARMVLNEFMQSVTPYAQQIMGKNESFFFDHNSEIPFVNELNLKDHWNDSLSQNTKDAIWQYLQTLYLMGMTISTIPDETLSMIESVAQKCMTSGALNEDALMSGMMGLLNTLGKSSGKTLTEH